MRERDAPREPGQGRQVAAVTGAWLPGTAPAGPGTEPAGATGPAGAPGGPEFLINLGPAHPSAHGMLRLRLTLDGDQITAAEPEIGFMHRGAEKLFEARDYRQIIVLANRHDWLGAFASELGVVLAAERLAGIEVPPRAVWARTMLAELNRALSHLAFLSAYPPEIAAEPGPGEQREAGVGEPGEAGTGVGEPGEAGAGVGEPGEAGAGERAEAEQGAGGRVEAEQGAGKPGEAEPGRAGGAGAGGDRGAGAGGDWAIAAGAQAAFMAREAIQSVMEEISGGRMHYMFNRVGGLKEEIPAGWLARACRAIDDVRAALPIIGAPVAHDRFRARTGGVGVLTPAQVRQYGVSGPAARACGVDFDLRRDEPYLAYSELAGVLRVPTGTAGDCLARFECLRDQLAVSLDLAQECAVRLSRLPQGPLSARLPKVFKVPEGHAYAWTEGPLGLSGYYLVSRGGKTPWRLKLRSASFSNMAVLPEVLPGHRVADLATILGSLFFIVGDMDK
jgi:NADH:ubiquinone oxidoreductase subunit D